MGRAFRVAILCFGGLAALAQDTSPITVSGSIHVDSSGSSPVAYAYVGVMSESYEMAGQGATGGDGRFSLELEKPVPKGYLMVQPRPRENSEGLGIYAAQPRIFGYDGEPSVEVRLPAAGCIVLKAYDSAGHLMRWQDFRARGTFGDQFMCLTSLDDRALPAVSWPVFDQLARDQGQARDLGLPALVTAPGDGYVPEVLFWDVLKYGRLLLRADNAGKGFTIGKAGDACTLELNVELARTAVHELAELKLPQAPQLAERLRNVDQLEDAAARANAADSILAEALRLRDTAVVEAARHAIPSVRMGKAVIRVLDSGGNPVPNADVRIEQQTSDFLFGVFEGSPYNAKAFQKARDAGFNLATVLLGWGWTDTAGDAIDRHGIEQTFGIGALKALGYTVKAHGVVWLQGYGILPDRARAMSGPQLKDALLAHEQSLLNGLDGDIAIWEAMNEPNVTNVARMPRPLVHELLSQSAEQIAAADEGNLVSLVNGAHEGDYGRKYALFDLDGSPVDDWNMTYAAFLQEAAFTGSTKNVDVIGLQYYPGFRFNESFGGLQGPATTPAWFQDLLSRYADFDKPLHITECSFPSSYGDDWTSGYWREPWTEDTQADYAEMIFTLAFGHPQVHSISWWDIMDTKASVITGGLLHADSSPKPVFERLSGLLEQWTRYQSDGKTNDRGEVTLPGFGGEYAVEITLSNGAKVSGTTHIQERDSTTVEIREGTSP